MASSSASPRQSFPITASTPTDLATMWQCYHDAVSQPRIEDRRKLFHDKAARIYRIESIPGEVTHGKRV